MQRRELEIRTECMNTFLEYIEWRTNMIHDNGLTDEMDTETIKHYLTKMIDPKLERPTRYEDVIRNTD